MIPVTLLSNFTGADENPLSEGGNWHALNTGAQMRRLANDAQGQSAIVNSGSAWAAASFGPICAARTDVVEPLLDGSNFVALRLSGVGTANWNGYILQLLHIGGVQRVRLQIVTAGINSDLTPEVIFGGTTDAIQLEAVGGTLTGYTHRILDTWTQRITAFDTTYATAGEVGMGGFSNNFRVTAFYAAEVSQALHLLPILGVGA